MQFNPMTSRAEGFSKPQLPSVYKEKRAWSDKYIPAIRKIVGEYLLIPSEFRQDINQSTDLLVIDARDMRIAARVRNKNRYFQKYKYQFTMRTHVKSGSMTEYEKIINGFGDWYFYGFVNEDTDLIENWWLIDLGIFRAGLIRDQNKQIFSEHKDNGDGTSFIAYDLRTFNPYPPILIASSHPLIREGDLA